MLDPNAKLFMVQPGVCLCCGGKRCEGGFIHIDSEIIVFEVICKCGLVAYILEEIDNA